MLTQTKQVLADGTRIGDLVSLETDAPAELEAKSYLLLARSRYENYEYQLLTCLRTDVLRRILGGGFKLARREILVDQSTLGVPNPAVFL